MVWVVQGGIRILGGQWSDRAAKILICPKSDYLCIINNEGHQT